MSFGALGELDGHTQNLGLRRANSHKLAQFYGSIADMGGLDTQGLKRLGRVAEARRKHLGYRQDNMPHGPSSTTVSAIEKGEQVSELSYRRLEKSLQWSSRDVHIVVDGGEPTPVATPAEARASASTSPGETVRRRVILDHYQDLADKITEAQSVVTAAVEVGTLTEDEAASMMKKAAEVERLIEELIVEEMELRTSSIAARHSTRPSAGPILTDPASPPTPHPTAAPAAARSEENAPRPPDHRISAGTIPV